MSRQTLPALCFGFALTSLGGAQAWAISEMRQTICAPTPFTDMTIEGHKNSLANAARLAAEANTPCGLFTSIPDSTLISSCRDSSQLANPTTYTNWIDGCNPNGIISAMKGRYPSHGYDQPHWNPPSVTLDTMVFEVKKTVMNQMVYWLANPSVQSPIMLPLDGRGSHWIVLWKLFGDFTNIRDAALVIQWTYFLYGYPAMDGYGKVLMNLKGTDNGPIFISKYISMLYEIKPDIAGVPGSGCSGCPACPPPPDPCLPCTPCNDPFIDKYIFLYDPPPGATLLAAKSGIPEVRWERAKGFVAPGETLTAERATRDVWEALRVSAVPMEGTLSRALQDTVAGDAYPVDAHMADGSEHRYFVVPMLDAARQRAAAFVQLDAADGAVLSVTETGGDFAYRPISAAQAAQLAAPLLHPGDQAGTPVLRWDFRERHPAASHPFAAFWDVPLERDLQTTGEVVRVIRNGGFLVGRTMARVASSSVH